MQEADRARFSAGIERLALVLPDRRPDAEQFAKLVGAYWKSLAKMDIAVFEAAVDRACETLERFPRPATLWNLSREVKRAAPIREETPAFGDALYGFANRVMFQWLWRQVCSNGPLDEERLQRVIRMKNDELAMHRLLIEDQDPEATPERFIDRFQVRADAIAETRMVA